MAEFTLSATFAFVRNVTCIRRSDRHPGQLPPMQMVFDIISGRLIELPALATDRFEVKVNDGHVLVSTEPSASLSR